MKHGIHTLQKYVLNPPIELALATGLRLPGYALLETNGGNKVGERGNGLIESPHAMPLNTAPRGATYNAPCHPEQNDPMSDIIEREREIVTRHIRGENEHNREVVYDSSNTACCVRFYPSPRSAAGHRNNCGAIAAAQSILAPTPSRG
jgi:hypothetical protein